MRLLLWIVLVVCAAVLQHSRLAGWPVAPDLPIALAAWAVVVGDPQAWMWRVWLAGALRDPLDPGSLWFHAGAHLVLVLVLLPLRRWIPSLQPVALLVTAGVMSALVQALDILIGGRGGWQWWTGALQVALTAVMALLLGLLMSGPKRTATVESEDQIEAPERSDGSATPT